MSSFSEWKCMKCLCLLQFSHSWRHGAEVHRGFGIPVWGEIPRWVDKTSEAEFKEICREIHSKGWVGKGVFKHIYGLVKCIFVYMYLYECSMQMASCTMTTEGLSRPTKKQDPSSMSFTDLQWVDIQEWLRPEQQSPLGFTGSAWQRTLRHGYVFYFCILLWTHFVQPIWLWIYEFDLITMTINNCFLKGLGMRQMPEDWQISSSSWTITEHNGILIWFY